VNAKQEIRLSAGPISYSDSGSGEPIVLLHGLLQDGRLWRKMVPLLEPHARVIVPDLPLGVHKQAMDAGADVSPKGVARLVGELIDKLGLERPTIVGVDTGGALAQLLLGERPEIAGRLVLGPSDAFEDFFPPLFKPLQLAARVPGGLYGMVAPMRRVRALRKLPVAFGWLTKRGFPDELTDEWVGTFLDNKDVRRDAVRFLRAIDSADTLDAAARLRAFDRPALIAWAEEEKVFPRSDAERLATILPNSRLEFVPDSYTFIPEDNPEAFAKLILEFMREGAPAAA
jgi:pimeloyl-ACP methyl ester carboxylesterase